MSSLYGQYLRSMMPFISSAPAASPEQEPNQTPNIDPAESEAVFRSYHHRLGRAPTLDELRGALGLETDEPLTVVQAQPVRVAVGLEPGTKSQPGISGHSPEAEMQFDRDRAAFHKRMAPIFRSMELNYGPSPRLNDLRRGLGLEVEEPAAPWTPTELPPYTIPTNPPVLDFFNRYIGFPIQRLMLPEDRKSRLRYEGYTGTGVR